MKNFIAILLVLILCSAASAQTVTLSGGCLSGSVTLTQVTSPALRNGKVHYSGSGVVNTTTDGPVPVPIELYWLGGTDNVWVLAYEQQPFYENTASTSRPPGSASPNFSWASSEPSLCGAAGAAANLNVAGPGVTLWVTFGSIDAYVKGNSLHVNWSTEKEVNNDHFEIEASTDGEQFTTIGNLESKAANGNSDVTLNYEWTTSANISLAMLPYIAAVLILLLFVRRKKIVFLASFAICFIAFVQTGCKKDKDAITKADNYYIRIAQIDKDGTKTYSKVVRVNGE